MNFTTNSSKNQNQDMSRSASPSPLQGHKSKTICRYFAAGKCTSGSRCAFTHIISSESKPPVGNGTICKFFQNGHCKFGSSCTLRHVTSSPVLMNKKFEVPERKRRPSHDDMEAHYPDMSHITSSIDQLSFLNINDSIEPSRSSSLESRSSFLPSFLVDELLLDSFDHPDSEGIATAPFTSINNQMTFGTIRTSLISYSSPDSSIPISPVNSKPPSPGFIKPPTSYGEAIKLGLQSVESNESSNIHSIFDSHDEIDLDVRNGSQPQYQPRPDELCAFSIMGKCRYGNFCRSVHGLQCPRCLLFVLHPTDMERNEEHLYECLSKPESVPISKLHQIQCGLCNEPVLQKIDPRFGLLNCNHAFCLTCIRHWRSTHFDANNDASRSCPHCEEVTYFIVPSSTWIDEHIEKIRVIDQYKKKMSLIPCKYFDYGRGECPFGSSCFYQHKSETCEAKAAYRHIIDHKEQIAKIRESKLSDYIVFKSATNRNKNKK